MAKKGLTHIAIHNLKPRGYQFEVSDEGCAGLRVTVFPSGKKSFIVRFRYRGLQRKLTLGPVATGDTEPSDTPAIGTPLSLEAARELATKALRQAKAKGGTDPTEEVRRKHEDQRAAETDTLYAVAQKYLRLEGGKLRSVDQRRGDLDLACATLGRLSVEEIKRSQYVKLFDDIAVQRGPVRADRVLTGLSRLLSWHAQRSDDFVNPLLKVERRTSIKDNARNRFLLDAEIQRVWLAAEQGGLFGDYVRFLLLTATRRNEALGLRRSELSADGKTWIIPAARYKQKIDVVIPLSPAAQAIVAAQPNVGDLVFSKTGLTELGGMQWRKAQIDAASGVTKWTLHDLRRTARTLLSRAGINADHAERCLGHVIQGVRGTYDRHDFEPEKRHAFEALASLVDRIVHLPAAGAIDFAAEREKRVAQ